ncbi:MAG TPA: trypsin-like peptidase domain-containing protein [Saprospiraceae bacterium]|nr:trypsin-like peptidase domain-containing protein [Saprospiraceae bacterium]HPI04821.1 trypsin-like peptidase domain-containing protein [Saprospiraceae bacterium]
MPTPQKNYIYKFVNSLGEELSPSEAVFAIITEDDKNQGSFKFSGTGFFINAVGGFVTAKHVCFDRQNKPIFPFYVAYVLPDNTVVLRHVKRFYVNPDSDVAVGMLVPFKDAQGKLIENAVLTLSKSPIEVGDEIKTVAYPKSKIITEDEKTQVGEFVADWYRGKVEEHFPDGRDSLFYPRECFRTSVEILGGASGGPVINSEGFVVGINSSGLDDLDDGFNDHVSFITPITEIFDIDISSDKGEKTTIRDLIQHGSIKIR